VTAPTLLLGRTDLAAIVERLGAEIAADHPDGVVLVGVLKGALIFLSDLARAIRGIDVEIDFMAISRFAPDSGRVRILKDIELDLSGRDVVVVEDMVDTGLTATYLCGQLAERGPRRLDLCTLLDRPVRRIVPLDVRYRGAEIPDVFVLGYGLHSAELYRNLDQVYEADQRQVRADPAAFVEVLYGGGAQAIVESSETSHGVTSAPGRRRNS
jgi:hypoxanthine phosphoribosyltransferase